MIVFEASTLRGRQRWRRQCRPNAFVTISLPRFTDEARARMSYLPDIRQIWAANAMRAMAETIALDYVIPFRVLQPVVPEANT